jgi:hypothetical protein
MLGLEDEVKVEVEDKVEVCTSLSLFVGGA